MLEICGMKIIHPIKVRFLFDTVQQCSENLRGPGGGLKLIFTFLLFLTEGYGSYRYEKYCS